MANKAVNGRVTVQQVPVVIPDLSVKDCLEAIPAHCFKRSTLKSMSYVVWDFILIGAIYKTTTFLETFIDPAHISLPHPYLYTAAWVSLWALYGFATGLVATGLWVCAHECGHRAFSESKFVNDAVGWVLHSGLGVPYHSWRITHAKHHASTAHLTQDQVFVPKTRSERKLPEFDPAQEDQSGSSVTEKVMAELWEALGDSPIGAVFGASTYLLFGWPLYLIMNASGQKRYPANTNHFNPSAIMFSPAQFMSIVLSDIGIVLWLSVLGTWVYYKGFAEVFRLYIVPYLWVNHWLVLITFLQHTDPILPHYRAPEFTFTRGALSTLDRSLLGDLGSVMAWIGASTTHGISETHVLHHVSSKIPHYNAWEAAAALRKRLGQAGLELQGRPGGWAEVYRVYKTCKFVEDDGDIVFYKNAHGLAAARPVFSDNSASDSGVELEKS
ncbi:delta12-fatty acid desaturase [Cristinia sonorae]|uniref:Delta12-fatty acid desaturase n=1 Tax=Cristinia sonorae TaxID=1940300 RepID=A0A8K0UWM4_9AGAR|nr:delta12-fatty acid desaturase [Cristinia sonorae]